jgi:lipopolysaccharide/colanic/teichoic acid biosynthesis glycosyltransferase
MKRALDFLASALGLAALLPLLSAIALVIKWHDGGPVFFRQERVGRGGKPFRIWKFRTMVVDAPSLGPPLTVGEDRRITPIGCWLRKYKLDEWPQLLNVLVGEMSLVGPRPEVPKYVALYSPEQRRIFDCRPGITDPASLEYFHESELLAGAADPQGVYIAQIMPAKLRINADYAQRATLLSDLVIIARTVLRVAGWKPRALKEDVADHRNAAA